MDSKIVTALIGAGATVAAPVITIVYTRRHDRPPPSNRHTSSVAPAVGSPDLDSKIIATGTGLAGMVRGSRAI
jgi:hypothetical protein